MDKSQAQREISIIKDMIEKTRKETANSGHLFVFIGLFTAFASSIIALLNYFELGQYVLPVIIIMVVVNGLTGLRVAVKESKLERIRTYSKTIFWNIWVVCGLVCVMIVFLFPNLDLYPFRAVPVLTSIVLGIAVFMSGAIFELKFIQWSGLVWWLGACLLALTESPYRFFILMLILIFGWIVPGLRLNRLNKNRDE